MGTIRRFHTGSQVHKLIADSGEVNCRSCVEPAGLKRNFLLLFCPLGLNVLCILFSVCLEEDPNNRLGGEGRHLGFFPRILDTVWVQYGDSTQVHNSIADSRVDMVDLCQRATLGENVRVAFVEFHSLLCIFLVAGVHRTDGEILLGCGHTNQKVHYCVSLIIKRCIAPWASNSFENDCSRFFSEATLALMPPFLFHIKSSGISGFL